jgi:hypothetical protein
MSTANTTTTSKNSITSNLSTICIDLEAVHAQTELNEDNLIQKHVYDSLKIRIDKRLKWVVEKSEENSRTMPSGSGWVSFIDGTRGAGKSTFLQTTLRLLSEDKNFNQLAVVGCIDPSRIESNEILLLTLLHALKEKVEGAFKRPPQSETDTDNRKKWEKAFHKVAGGLVMFQKNHDPLKELDEDLFLNIGIERAGHSAKLREHLAQLLEVACNLLNKEALLFAFDDADTNSKHAIALLEVIRKYLDTPRVLVLLTGDLELYALLVRQKFRRELAQGKTSEWGGQNAANDRSVQQSRMLDHLEEQYLLKLFPVQERHALFPLWRLADETGARTANFQYQVKVKDNKTSLIQFVNDQIKQGFRLTTRNDIALYTEFFLMQPLRSVLQTLARIATVDQNENPQAFAHEFSQAMIAMSLQNLYQVNIPVDELVAENFHALTETVFEIAMADGDPDTSAYLRPNSAEVHNRSAMFGLSAAVAQQLRGKPGTCFTYLLRGPGMVKLMHDAIDSNKRDLDEDVLMKEFRRYMGPGRRDDALGWSRLASAALVAEYASNANIRWIHYGVIGINQRTREPQNDKASGSKAFSAYQKVFDEIAKDGKPYPAAAFSLVNFSVKGTGSQTYASIYNILGLMGRLLELAEKTGYEEIDGPQIEKLLLSQYPNTNSVGVPPWIVAGKAESLAPAGGNEINGVGKNDEDKVEEEGDGEESDSYATDGIDTSITKWVEPLQRWIRNAHSIKDNIAPSSLTIGKVMPRLFYGLTNISDALRFKSIKQRDFASAMELFALCVVNAFLAEESAYHLPNDGLPDPIFLVNPRTSALDYIKRLNGVSKKFKSDKLPLTYIVATCPLITGLISASKASDKWPFTLNISFDETHFIEDANWTKLETVSIAGKKDGAATDRQSQIDDVTEPQNKSKKSSGKNSKTSATPTEPSE